MNSNVSKIPDNARVTAVHLVYLISYNNRYFRLADPTYHLQASSNKCIHKSTIKVDSPRLPKLAEQRSLHFKYPTKSSYVASQSLGATVEPQLAVETKNPTARKIMDTAAVSMPTCDLPTAMAREQQPRALTETQKTLVEQTWKVVEDEIGLLKAGIILFKK